MKVLVGLISIIVVLLIIFGVEACSGNLVDEDIAVRALETQGFSNIEIIEKDVWFVPLKGGGEGDVVKFTALATNPAGKKVEVSVYVGWPFKAATIRNG